jgi:hypothetical protein
MSILTGIRYTMYTGHLTGIDTGRFQSIYTLSEQGLIAGDTPVIKLDLKWKSRFEKIETPQLLVLGQSYTDYRFYKSRHRQIFDYVRSNYGKQFKLFYKAHPNEKVVPGFMDMLKDFNIDFITTDRPVEYFAGAYQIIVSEFSSALSNIKIIYGDGIRCIGFIKIPERRLFNNYRRNRLIEIKEHFRHMGVEVIEQ